MLVLVLLVLLLLVLLLAALVLALVLWKPLSCPDVCDCVRLCALSTACWVLNSLVD